MSVAADLKRLGGQTLVYGIGSIFLRAVAFLMLPVYTRFLSREDYGVVGLATAVVSVLAIVFPLGLHGALSRLYTDAKDEDGRREALGTLWLASVVAAGLLGLVAEGLGAAVGDRVSKQVPFHPFLRMAVWLAFAQALPLVVAAYLQMSERPVAYLWVTAAPILLSTVLIVVEVVLRKGGAEGFLRGTLAGAALGALPALWMVVRRARWTWRPELLRRALAYSLPLVLHAGAAWLLVVSDRLILERYVPLSQVGLYTVAFQVAAIVTVAAQAMNAAWSPFVFRRVAEEGEAARDRLRPLATYFVAAATWAALGVAVGGRDIFRLMAGADYQDGHLVLPWLALGMLLGAFYLLPATFLFVRSRTGWISGLTVASGLVSMGLNLALIPRFGWLAAGWSAVLGNLVLLLLVGAAAPRLFPMTYEAGRILRVLATAIAVYATGRLLPADPWGPMLALRVLLWAAYPAVLAATGFLTAGERAAIGARLRTSSKAGGSGPP